MQVFISNTLLILVFMLAIVTVTLLSALIMVYRYFKLGSYQNWISKVNVESGTSKIFSTPRIPRKIQIKNFNSRDEISFYWLASEEIPVIHRSDDFLANESLMKTYKFRPKRTSTYENLVEI